MKNRNWNLIFVIFIFSQQLALACPVYYPKLDGSNLTNLRVETICTQSSAAPVEKTLEFCTFPQNIPISYYDGPTCYGYLFQYTFNNLSFVTPIQTGSPASNPNWILRGTGYNLNVSAPGTYYFAFVRDCMINNMNCGTDLRYLKLVVKKKGFSFDIADVTICPGETLNNYGYQTSVPPVGGYGNATWSPMPNPLSPCYFSACDLSPSTTTTYSVTYTNLEGCTYTDQFTVFVQPIAPVFLIKDISGNFVSPPADDSAVEVCGRDIEIKIVNQGCDQKYSLNIHESNKWWNRSFKNEWGKWFNSTGTNQVIDLQAATMFYSQPRRGGTGYFSLGCGQITAANDPALIGQDKYYRVGVAYGPIWSSKTALIKINCEGKCKPNTRFYDKGKKSHKSDPVIGVPR